MGKRNKSHLELVRGLLERRSNVTVADAERVGVSRLAARIFDLRASGLSISTGTRLVKGRKVTSYSLESR